MPDQSSPSDAFGSYPFALSADHEARAARLHSESIICDMLFQGPCGYRSWTPAMDKKMAAAFERHGDHLRIVFAGMAEPAQMALRDELPDFKDCFDASGITAGNRQVALEASPRGLPGVGLTMAQFDHFPWLVKALTAADIRTAKEAGKHAGYVTSQDAGLLGSNVELLDAYHQLGVRMIALTYNAMNLIGAGCTERTDAGVSHFGAQLIARMNDLGIIVDTGHSGHQTTLDAAALSKAPIVASHTSAAAVYPVDRAKADDEIRAIASTGGVIGVYAVPFFLAPGEDVTIEAMLDHIDYIANLVGCRHVGIGTDWPLQVSKDVARHLDLGGEAVGFRDEHKLDSRTNLIGFDDYRDFPNITRGLVARGYDDEQVRGILGENFLRVFDQVVGE